mgnify:CR=1 FL=1
MAVECVVLEHHGHIAVLSGRVGNVLAVQQQLAAGYIFQTCHHSQRGGLAAAGGADQNDQFAVFYIEVEVIYGLDIIVIDLIQVL